MKFQATPETLYGMRGRAVQGSAIDASLSVLAGLGRSVISFAMGSPAADAIPRQEIADAAAHVLASSRGDDALDYAPTEGHPELRQELLGRLERAGAPVDADSLLITTGGMQGIDLVCRLFLDPGDLVLAESPSYANGLATLHNHGARIVQVPMDAEGMDLGAAREAIATAGSRPKLIYAIPTFQNPSGLSYSLERRLGLIDLAHSTGALIVEDEPYRDLRYEGMIAPSLLELDEGRGSVVGVSTFSKIVAPGLRVGWIVAAPDTVARMVAARQSMDTCASVLGQRIIARLIETGALDAHIDRLRDLYPRRRDAMIDALAARIGEGNGIRWTRPTGGMFIWVDLPDGIDGSDVLAVGLGQGVAVVPGAAFDPVRCRSAFRLCFTAQDERSIGVGVERLAVTLRTVLASETPASA